MSSIVGKRGKSSVKKSVVEAIQRMDDCGFLVLVASAVLFLIGTSRFKEVGMKVLADVSAGSVIVEM